MERDAKRLLELEATASSLKVSRKDVDAAHEKTFSISEALHALEEDRKASLEEITRLNKHVADLESRKRAPLYQRKQVCLAVI